MKVSCIFPPPRRNKHHALRVKISCSFPPSNEIAIPLTRKQLPPQSSICFHFEKGGNKKYVKYTAASETCEEHKHKRVSIVHTGNAINFIESIVLLFKERDSH